MTSDARSQIVLGIGELLWDCFPDGRRPGGAPANVVYHVTQLGHRGVLASRIGADDDGRELRGLLAQRGIDLACLQDDPERPTGRVTVDVSEPGSPRFEIHRDVAWDAIELDATLSDIARQSAALCVGTLAQRGERSRETIRRCLDLARDALSVYDVNLRPPFYRREWIEETLERVTLVKLNDDELTTLDALLDIRSEDPAGFSHALMERFGVESVCITRGAAGCLVVTGREMLDVPGEPVDVVDAVGAGDAFTAGMITGSLRGWTIARTARFANWLGARVAGRAGAMPDLAGVLEDRLKGHDR